MPLSLQTSEGPPVRGGGRVGYGVLLWTDLEIILMEVVRVKLRCFGKVRSGSAIGVDNFPGKKIVHAFAVLRFVGGKNVVESTILTHDNNYVLDGTGGFWLLLRL
jgi:hypothetical protein